MTEQASEASVSAPAVEVMKPVKKASKKALAKDARKDSPEGGAALEKHRRLQACVAEILEGLFGGLRENKPQLWAKRVNQLLIGVVYERLATSQKELSTDELMTLARALSEAQRADPRKARTRRGKRRGGGGRGDATGVGEDSPEVLQNMAELVREVYGTQWHGRAGANPAGAE